MTCAELQARVAYYVDGELPVSEIAAVDAHVARCSTCVDLVGREREFRRLLRRQPREPAPPEFRTRLAADLASARRRRALRSWLAMPAVAAVAAAVVVAMQLTSVWHSNEPVADLVDKHIAYSQVARPAELVSTDRSEIADWFRKGAGLQVTVPDFSAAGIRLVGARLADAREHKAAYLLYEKGRTLLSVFAVPASGPDARLGGRSTAYRSHEYVTSEWKGHRTVAWIQDRTLFGLVSMLDYDSLLECADRLRTEHASRSSL
jgi:mycothiol system anti-sigma-R factor